MRRRGITVRIPLRVLACAALVLACGKGTTPTPDTKAKSILEPRGIEEMKRVKQDVQDAHKAGLQRNDDAIDRAQKAEAVGRGTPGR